MAETPKGVGAGFREWRGIERCKIEMSESKRQTYLHMLEYHRDRFERDGNPLSVWLGYLNARNAGVDIPDWILEYLDWCARGMFWLWQESLSGEKIDHTMVAKALDVVGQPGEGNAFSKYDDGHWMILAEKVGIYIWKGETKEYLAIDRVAEKFNVSVSTVQRAWKKYQTKYPERVNEILGFTNPPIS